MVGATITQIRSTTEPWLSVATQVRSVASAVPLDVLSDTLVDTVILAVVGFGQALFWNGEAMAAQIGSSDTMPGASSSPTPPSPTLPAGKPQPIISSRTVQAPRMN